MTISIQDDSSVPLDLDQLEQAVAMALAFHGQAPQGEVEVQLVSADQMRALNANFRGCDEVTDVLTFPAATLPGLPPEAQPVGAIAVCREEAQRAVQAHNTSLQAEVEILAVHGALHLIGLEDENEDAQAEMRSAMEQVFAQLGRPLRSNWASLPHLEAK